MRSEGSNPKGGFWSGEEIPLFSKMYFELAEVVELTGIAAKDVRYWRTCCRRLYDRRPRKKYMRLRFTADQIIIFLLIHELTRGFGMTVAGAVDVLMSVDLEGFVEAKIERGESFFSRSDLNVLLQIQITRRSELLFGSAEFAETSKPLIINHLGIGRRLARGVLKS